MRLSRYFLPTFKDNPKGAEIASHRLMMRSGMIHQVASGLYTWLPLGLKVLKKVEEIVRQEQNRIGCLEILAPTLQPASLWHKSFRYNDYGDELLRIQDRHGIELVYGPTAEEVFTDIFSTYVHSYKEVPMVLYNIQWKFRDEIRPRFGVMRGREFLMKDAYSFDLDAESAKKSYARVFRSYLRTFKRLGLTALPLQASTGPIGGDLSHEFHILAKTGESRLFYDEKLEHLCQSEDVTLESLGHVYAMADDRHDPENCPVPKENLRTSSGIEVGHVFYFGTKYSKNFKAYVTDGHGNRVLAEMGSYGIGVSRLVGALIEAFHDDRGMRWPFSVAPYAIGLASFEDSSDRADQLYDRMISCGLDVLYHDKNKSPGEKLSEMDLIGCPLQVILSHRQKDVIQVKRRFCQEASDTFLEFSVSDEEGLFNALSSYIRQEV